MDSNFLVYLGAAVLSWVLFYYTIKAAVTNGILAANKDEKFFQQAAAAKEPELSLYQRELKSQYEAGKISFDEYRLRFDERNTSV